MFVLHDYSFTITQPRIIVFILLCRRLKCTYNETMYIQIDLNELLTNTIMYYAYCKILTYLNLIALEKHTPTLFEHICK